MSAEKLSDELEALAATYAKTDASLRQLAKERESLIIEAVAAGIPKRVVARQAGVARETVYRILREADVTA